MKFKNTQVTNFEGAFRGLRNPLESWQKSDSFFGFQHSEWIDNILWESANEWLYKIIKNDPDTSNNPDRCDDLLNEYSNWLYDQGIIRYDEDIYEVAFLGPNDLSLAQKMIKAGSSDRKFLRQINVSVDVIAPLYWWKEFDTYKIGTTANSTSTMHKIASTPITKKCFEMEDLDNELLMFENNEPYSPNLSISEYWDTLVQDLEYLRKKYNQTKDKRYWKELIRLLPEAWLQTRTVTMNYEVLRNMYSQRKNHRLTEWHTFCDWVESLPYAKELILHNLD